MRLLPVKLIGLAFIGTLGFSSCGSGEGNAGTEDSTFGEKVEAATEDVADAFAGDPNKRFVNDAVELNAKELAWLNAGVKNGSDAGLKKDAGTMLKEHEKLGADIKAYANQRSIEIPTVSTEDEVNISEDKGRDWDRKWVDQMVEDHEQAIDEFENAQAKVDAAELKSIIDNALPKLRAHLEMVRKLKEKLDK